MTDFTSPSVGRGNKNVHPVTQRTGSVALSRLTCMFSGCGRKPESPPVLDPAQGRGGSRSLSAGKKDRNALLCGPDRDLSTVRRLVVSLWDNWSLSPPVSNQRSDLSEVVLERYHGVP